MGCCDNVDVVAGISYDWRDSVEAKNMRKMAVSPIMTTTISQLLMAGDGEIPLCQ